MFQILLSLIFIRPFISSLAFPYLNYIHSALVLIFLITWLTLHGTPLNKIKPLKYPLILFCLALIISLVFSSNKINSFKELYKYINGLCLFLTAASLSYNDKIKVIRAIVFSGFIISLLAIYQYFFGFRHILDYISKEGITNPFTLDYIQRKRAFFPFVTPNILGGYLAMIIPLAFTHKNKIWLIISISFALLLTQSLGVFLSLFLALSLYFYSESGLDKRRIILLFGLSAIIGVFFILRSLTYKQHLQPIFSTTMRLGYWKDTLEMINASPLTGVGIGNFNLIQSRYAHNSYLQIWAEMGILGIVSILWLIVAVFKSLFKNIGKPPDKKLITGLIIANVVFLIHNFIDFSFFLPEVSLIWWVLLGLLYANFTLADK